MSGVPSGLWGSLIYSLVERSLNPAVQASTGFIVEPCLVFKDKLLKLTGTGMEKLGHGVNNLVVE